MARDRRRCFLSFLLAVCFALESDEATTLLALVVAVLPALAGVSTMWQAQAGLGARGQVKYFCGFVSNNTKWVARVGRRKHHDSKT